MTTSFRLQEDRLTAAGSAEAGVVRMSLSGEAVVPDAAARALTKLHGGALAEGAKEVIIDLTELAFMNSSCFKQFVSWIAMVSALEEPKRYKMRFLSNPKMRWQQRSLHALQCFAANLIVVDVV